SRDLGYGRVDSEVPLPRGEETKSECSPPPDVFQGRFIDIPKTLNEFATLWNELYHAAIHRDIEFDHNIFFTHGNRRISQPYPWKEVSTDLDAESDRLELIVLDPDESDSLGRDAANQHFKFAFRGGWGVRNTLAYIPISFTKAP